MNKRRWKQVVGAVAGGGIAALLLFAGQLQAQEWVPAPDSDQPQDANGAVQAPATSEGGKAEEKKPAVDKKLEADIKEVLKKIKKEDDEKKKKDDEKKKKEAEEIGVAVGSEAGMKDFKVYWGSAGVTLEGPNKDFKIHVGGRMHQDWGWFNPDEELSPRGWNDGADFRRLRLRADGTCWEVIDWVTEIDFTTGVSGTTNHPVATDVYFDIKYLPVVGTFRAGHFKEPFSFEDYGTSSRYLNTMERSTAHDAFDPQRNIGMMFFNNYFDEHMTFATGFFRANSDNNSGNTFDYGDHEYAYTTRMTFCPYYENDGRCWAHIGGAYSRRYYDPSDSSSRARYSSRIPLRVGSPTVVDTGSLTLDNDDRLNAQAALTLGPLTIQSEYYYVQTHNVRRGTVSPGVARLLEPAFDGFYVQASYFLTGEHIPYRRSTGTVDRVKVHEPFHFVRRGDPDCDEGTCCGKGAWKVVFRYELLNLGSPALGAFPGASAVTTRGQEQDFVAGLNWYLNSHFKVLWEYVYADINGTNLSATTQSGHVHALGMRFAYDF